DLERLHGFAHGVAREAEALGQLLLGRKAIAGAEFAGDDHRLDLLDRLVCDCHGRSEEHTSELQSRENLVCRLLLEKKKLYDILLSLPYSGYELRRQVLLCRCYFRVGHSDFFQQHPVKMPGELHQRSIPLLYYMVQY